MPIKKFQRSSVFFPPDKTGRTEANYGHGLASCSAAVKQTHLGHTVRVLS